MLKLILHVMLDLPIILIVVHNCNGGLRPNRKSQPRLHPTWTLLIRNLPFVRCCQIYVVNANWPNIVVRKFGYHHVIGLK
ncbi:hypothetical protein GJ496_006337 [Pomphorhynchus laevis]|nr:hypothetical protein GJ496_006337 [Pomphorhynchus laevis]